MDIVKPNDILVASINNPNSTTLDFLSADVTPDNTSLFKKEDYLTSPLIKKIFTDEKGQFNTVAFNEAYNKAATHYKEMTDDSFLKNLTEITYSPFDVTRPLGTRTFDTRAQFTPDFNPFKQLYSRTGINSLDDNSFTLRELAQQNKVYDAETKTWSEKTANDLGIFEKFFGDTLVYAQWDQDGFHADPISGRSVKHKKGDWKFDNDGNLYLEKLGKREIYGKQVVNPMDMLTTDGSLANQFDFFDSDSRDKSVGGVTTKLIFNIAPFFIPGVAPVYGGIKAAVNLAAVLPSFYKSFEGILLGDNKSPFTDTATAAESYMAKFSRDSVSDSGQQSFFNYEQMSQMVGQIFGQIHEQRAVASLSTLIKKPGLNRLSEKGEELAKKINDELINDVVSQKISIDKFYKLRDAAFKKIPELQSVIKSQSKISKGLALGYMALTQSSDVYSQAMQGGYDRRTAGFAALTAAAGQYGLMANNRMGDWFLDKTTGYSLGQNRALIRKAVLPWLDEFKTGMDLAGKNVTAGKVSLAGTISKVKRSFNDLFMTPSVLGEAMWKNAIVEGVEEVTEQVAIDATKGIVDAMSYLGLTKKQGSFGGIDVVFSKSGLENYLANFIGGVLGGGLFEFQRVKIDPLISGKAIALDTKEELYDLLANGKKDEIIDIIKKEKTSWGNQYIGPIKDDNSFDVADGKDILSVADVIANNAIQVVERLDGLLNSEGLLISDEDIVRKTLRDHILIEQLKLDRGKSIIGLEGVILEDLKRNRSEIMRITVDINSLISKDEVDKTNNYKDVIKDLEEERKLYKKNVEEILSGNKSEYYFGQAAWYLSKPISDNFIVIDKETFVQINYGKSYNELPEEGLNVSKKRIDEEYKKYIDSKNIRNYLKLGYDTYLDIEKNLNPEIDNYVKSGYVNEVTKTFKNLLNPSLTNYLFDTTGENTVRSIQNYLERAKKEEEKTGKRILPWEAINSELAKNLMSSNIFTIKKGEELITLGETQLSKNEIAERVLANIIGMLPPEQVDYNVVREMFNQKIQEENGQILEAKKEELAPIINEYDSITDEEIDNDVIKKARKEELANQINSHLIEANLNSVEELESFKNNFQTVLLELQEKFERELGLTDKIIEKFGKLSKVEKFPGISESASFQEKLDLLPKYNQILELGLNIGEVIESFKEVINNSNLSDEEKTALLNGENYEGNNSDILEALQIYNATIQKMVDLVNANMIEYNEEIIIYNKYKNEVEKVKKDLIRNLPQLFGITDVLVPAIIKELKVNKNLDGELLNLAKDLINSYLKPFTSLSTGFSISNEAILTLSDFSDSELHNLISGLKTVSSEFLDENEEFTVKFWEAVKSFEKKLPKDIIDAINLVETSDYKKQEVLITAINPLISMLQKVLNTKKSLKPIKELVDLTINEADFIKNSLYDFIKKFNVYLDRDSKIEIGKIWDIWKMEESKLFNGSTVDSYFSSGLRIQDLTSAINVINMLQSAIRAMSTTQLTYNDPIGFIASRQAFAKRNEVESEVTKLKTITSDVAELMIKDLNRIKLKLQFLKDLSKYNSGLIAKEQVLIKNKFNKLLVNNWSRLVMDGISFKEKPIIPDLTEILNSKDNDEQKLTKIEDLFYTQLKSYSLEEKIEIGKLFANKFKFRNVIEDVYSHDGNDEITKDIKSISNNDMLVYLLSIMSINSSDFNLKLSNALKTGFDKAPFFTQELGLKIMYASTVNPELFQETLITLSPVQKGEDITQVQSHDTTLITYVLGNAGAGKTTVMYKLYLSLLQQSNKHLNVWFSAPNTNQADKLSKDVLNELNQEDSVITSTNFSKEELLNKLGLKEIIEKIVKDGKSKILPDKEGETLAVNQESYLYFKEEPKFEIPTDLPELIFIDEVSYYSALELDLINKVVKLATSNDGKLVKVFAAGDRLQRGLDFNTINYNVDRVSGIFIPNLFLTVRAQNNQKRYNNDILSNVVRNTSKLWIDLQKSTDRVFSDIIQDGISLSYYVDSNTFHGDKIIENIVPLDLLTSIANDIVANPTKVIGILTDSGIISEDLKIKLDSLKVPQSNYQVMSPDKVAGQEFDYFIYNLSTVAKEKSIFDALKAINTYSSRAKDGTIIINDEEIFYNDTLLRFVSKEDSYTEPLIPLSKEIIKDLKDQRIEELKVLLDGKTTISDDFVFNTEANVTVTSSEDPTISTDDTSDSIDSESDLQDSVLKFSLTELSNGIYKGSQHTMIHTFYHDNNVIESKNGNKIRITKNPKSKYSYGLNYILNQTKKDSLDLSQEEYNESMKFLVKSKFKILKEKEPDVEILKTLFGKSTITLDDLSYSGFVITIDSYNEASNKPRSLKYDDKDKHLVEGTKYVNLMYRMTLDSGEEYFLHLGTFPDIETVKRIVKENFANDPYKQKIIESYQSLLDDNIPGNIIKVNIKAISTITSTRLWGERVKDEDKGTSRDKRKRSSLRELIETPGILFYNSAYKVITKPQIQFFPSDFESYKRLFVSTYFGEILNKGDKEKFEASLKESFEGNKDKKIPPRAGKPYIIVSFVNDKKSVRFVTLHSTTRTWKEIDKIITGDSNKASLSSRIMIAAKNLKSNEKSAIDSENLSKAYAEAGSLFSGNDVLDLLVSLGVERPELFKKLLSNGNAWLESILGVKDENGRKFIYSLFKDLTKTVERTILDAITNNNGGAIEVYKIILREVDKENKDSNAIKKMVLDEVIKKDKAKFWFKAFWNIFKLQEKLAPRIEQNTFGSGLDKEFLEVINAVTEFWEGKKDKIYYNIPIKVVKTLKGGKHIFTADMADESILDNLYTNLSPEGPKLLIDLKGIVKVGINPSKEKLDFLNNVNNISEAETRQIASDLNIITKGSIVTIRNRIANGDTTLDEIKEQLDLIRNSSPEAQELIKLVAELSKITYNKKPIIKHNVTDDSVILKNKIEKASLIKSLLPKHKFEDLISMSIKDLQNLISKTSPETEYIQSLKKMKLTSGSTSDRMRERLLLMLEGKKNDATIDSDPELIVEIVKVLNFIKGNNVNLAEILGSLTNSNFANFLSKIVKIDPSNELWDNIPKLDDC